MITKNSSGQNLSADFISALTSDNRTYDAKLLLDGTELECSIVRLTITKGSCGSEEAFSVGNVVGSTLVAEVKELSTGVKGEEIEVRIGVSVSGGYEYVKLGYFTVSEAQQNLYTTTITAYGVTITKTGDAFVPPATQTLANIASSIASSISVLAGRTVTVSFESGITTSKTITASLNGLTVYQALQVLAGVVGGYVIDTYDGNIRICRFNDTPTLSRDSSIMRQLPVIEEEDFEIVGVLCVVTPESEDEEGTIIPAVQYPASPTGNENLVLQNQYVTQDLYTTFLSTLAGYEYRPATIEMAYGDPRLEGNDVLQVTDMDESVYIIPCHMITHTYSGGFTTQVISVAATQQENEIASAGNLTEQLSDLSANVISAKTSAISAKASAEAAAEDASAAASSASSAAASASASASSASSAASSASSAAGDAHSANESANAALTQLGTVEDVIGVVNWMLTHGTFKLTEDTTADENTKYYAASAVTSPTGNPRSNSYYEKNASNEYRMSIDTSVDSQKTYYTLTEVTPASGSNPHSLGYLSLLNMDDIVAEYINTHLALTSEGLYVLSDESEWKVLIADDGVYIIDSQGSIVAKYKEIITLGNDEATNPTYSKIDSSGLKVTQAGEEVAVFGNSTRIGKLNDAPKVVIDNGTFQVWTEGNSIAFETYVPDTGGKEIQPVTLFYPSSRYALPRARNSGPIIPTITRSFTINDLGDVPSQGSHTDFTVGIKMIVEVRRGVFEPVTTTYTSETVEFDFYRNSQQQSINKPWFYQYLTEDGQGDQDDDYVYWALGAVYDGNKTITITASVEEYEVVDPIYVEVGGYVYSLDYSAEKVPAATYINGDLYANGLDGTVSGKTEIKGKCYLENDVYLDDATALEAAITALNWSNIIV